MDLSEYREDSKKWGDGVPIYTNAGTFYVRRWGTREANEKLAEIEREEYNPFSNLTDAERQQQTIEIRARWLAVYGVCGWDDVKDNGKTVKFSRKEAYDIFTNPEYFMSLNALLISKAMDYEAYLFDKVEEDIEQVKK